MTAAPIAGDSGWTLTVGEAGIGMLPSRCSAGGEPTLDPQRSVQRRARGRHGVVGVIAGVDDLAALDDRRHRGDVLDRAPAGRRRARRGRPACPARPSRCRASCPMNRALSSVAIEIASSGENPESTRNSSSRCRLRPGHREVRVGSGEQRAAGLVVAPQQALHLAVAGVQLGEVVGVVDVVQLRRRPDRRGASSGTYASDGIVGVRGVLGGELSRRGVAIRHQPDIVGISGDARGRRASSSARRRGDSLISAYALRSATYLA